MDYATSKIVLWIMLCFPILVFGLFALNNLVRENRKISKYKKAKSRAAYQQAEAERELIRQRALFDASYDDYLSRKYQDTQDYE